MKLEFILLVVDDAPDNVEPAILALEDHLNTQGFHLKQEVATDLSEQGLDKLADSQGRNYDLVMVDYNLGLGERNGAVVASQLRQRLPYVDMIFYSSMPVSELHKYLADQKVPGVFPAIRENLGDALKGVTDTVIRKAVDLNHMRGIAMAEVAEMDVLMTQTLVRVFHSNNEQIGAAMEKTIERLRGGMENNSLRLQNHLDNGGLPAVVDDSLLFSLANKYQAIRRVAKCLSSELRNELEVVNSYEEDIIRNRNMLAHVREDTGENGQTILRTVGRNQSEVIINETWMSDFRQKLLRHRAALVVICETLDRQFGGAES
ncbi:MAG: response regulator [Gammaproteobacteria bacterium]|nr:response regulator [Gammaproteobacteria bacterium]